MIIPDTFSYIPDILIWREGNYLKICVHRHPPLPALRALSYADHVITILGNFFRKPPDLAAIQAGPFEHGRKGQENLSPSSENNNIIF